MRRLAILVALVACGGDDGAPVDAATDATPDARVADSGPTDGGTPDAPPPPPACAGRFIAATLSEVSMARSYAGLSLGTRAPDERVRLRARTLSSHAGLEMMLDDVPRDRFVLIHVT